MNPETTVTAFDDTTANDDLLSLRNLQLDDRTATSSAYSSPRTSSVQDVFEFFNNTITPCPAGEPEDIMFCGKVIPEEHDELNEYQKRDYLSVVCSSSFRLSDRLVDDEVVPARSVSSRDLGTGNRHHPVKCSTTVNMTALTTMSSKSKRRMFMFGPVKFKPEMELSAIKERQGRRTPSLFPVTEGGGDAAAMGKVVAGGKCAHKNHWGLVRTLRCRAHLNSVLARSLACIPIHRL